MNDDSQVKQVVLPGSSDNSWKIRAAITAAGGLIPFVGGTLSAGSAAWAEHEQAQVNMAIQSWINDVQEKFQSSDRAINFIISELDRLSSNNSNLSSAETIKAIAYWTRFRKDQAPAHPSAKQKKLEINVLFSAEKKEHIQTFEIRESTRIGDFLDHCYLWIENFQALPEFDYGNSWILRNVETDRYWRSVGPAWAGTALSSDRRDPRLINDSLYFPGHQLEAVLLG